MGAGKVTFVRRDAKSRLKWEVKNPPIKNQCHRIQTTPYYKRASAKSDSLTDFTYRLTEKTEERNVLIGILFKM